MSLDHADRDALLELMHAGHADAAAFRRQALAWLGRGIEFDGWVWGAGHRCADGHVEIDDARLEGRSRSLLDGFGEVAALDPVSRRFADQPRRLQNVSVAQTYADSRLRPVGDYLRRHRVGQLMLAGVTHPANGGLCWLTLYREDVQRGFSEAELRFAEFALPFVLLAGAGPGAAARASAEPKSAHSRRAPAAAGSADSAIRPLLTPREREVAHAYAAGDDYKTIARRLALSPATVRSHLLAIFRKLGVHNKIELRRRITDRGAG